MNLGGPAEVWEQDQLSFSIKSSNPSILTGEQGEDSPPVLAVDIQVGNGPQAGLKRVVPGRDLVLTGPNGVCQPVLECEVKASPCSGTASIPGFAPSDSPEQHTLYFQLDDALAEESLGDYSLFVIDYSGAAIARFAAGQPEPTTRPSDQCTGAWRPQDAVDVEYGTSQQMTSNGQVLLELTVNAPTLTGDGDDHTADFTIVAGGSEQTSGIVGSSVEVRDSHDNLCPLVAFDAPANANSVSAADGDHPFGVRLGPEVDASGLTTDLTFGWSNIGDVIWRWRSA